MTESCLVHQPLYFTVVTQRRDKAIAFFTNVASPKSKQGDLRFFFFVLSKNSARVSVDLDNFRDFE